LPPQGKKGSYQKEGSGKRKATSELRKVVAKAMTTAVMASGAVDLTAVAMDCGAIDLSD
jgi:hypothetical protein